MSEWSVCLWEALPSCGGGARTPSCGVCPILRPPAVGTALEITHACVLGGRLSLPEGRAPGNAWYGDSLGQHCGGLMRG